MRSYPLPVYEYVSQELIWDISSLTEHIGNFTGAFDVCRVSIVGVMSSPQCLDSGLRIRKEMSSTLYITLPAAAGVAEVLPARTVWKAVTRRGSTDGGATGMLWAPRTTWCDSCGARRNSYPHHQHRPHSCIRLERAAEPSRCQFLLGEAATLIALHMIAWGEATVCWIRRSAR